MSCGLKQGFISWCLSVCWDCLGHFGQRVFFALMSQWVLVYFGQIGFIQQINSKKKLEIYSHENWEISILTIKKGRTRFKTFLPLKQDISNFCWCQSTTSRYRLKNWEERKDKREERKQTTIRLALWITMTISQLFRDHQQFHVWWQVIYHNLLTDFINSLQWV